jgi:hypothetical protein
VSAVSSDNKRTDEYWMGVRDALRMVDSFNKWAERNPERAKSLDDFIHDGLIAAAKRCESCLREKLGLSFIQENQSEADTAIGESSEPETLPPSDSEPAEEDTAGQATHRTPDTSYEIAVESTEYNAPQEIPIESDDSSLSIDSVERLEDESMNDIVIEGPQREFTTDFVLVEPPPLVVDTDEQELGPAVEESLDELELEELEVAEETPQEPEIVEKRTAFTWSDYEAAVTPNSKPEPPESDYDEYLIEEDDYVKEPLAEDTYISDDGSIAEPPEPSEAPKELDTHEEVSRDEEIPLEEHGEDEDEESKDGFDTTEDTEQDDSKTSITEPPAPPPPPESEEDEEERRRRARRLFFGA